MALERFEIKNRFTGAVQVTAEIECEADASYSVKLGLAVKWAFKARANLAGADLAGADLARADLAGANLAGADLAGANLARADLAGAYLAGADLAGANLARANLAGANLARAYLAGAYLAGANLARANGIQGFASFGPVGKDRRYGWATVEDGAVKIRLGCFAGDLEKTCAAIVAKYGEGSTYEALVRAAVTEMLAYAPAKKEQSDAA